MNEKTTTTQHLDALDWVKACAIVAVVFNHAPGPLLFHPNVSEWDRVLAIVWTPFHVPSFLFVSSFLYARTHPIAAREVASRLGRVLVPYLVASLLVQTLGLSTAKDLGDVVFQLATASSLGTYYYVFLIAIMIPLLWPLSRLGRRSIATLFLACLAFTVATALAPQLHFTRGWFWPQRDPSEHFFLGFFLAGWLSALMLPELRRLYLTHRAPLAAAAGLAVVSGALVKWLALQGVVSLEVAVIFRVIYTFSIIGCIVAVAQQRRASRWVRFLSEATLTIYLYHQIFQIPLRPFLVDWHPLARVIVQVAAGLAGGSAVALLGRRALGRRSRLLLGA